MKSYAPFLIHSTAVSIEPCPEIMITGDSTPASKALSRNSSPSILGILMSEKIASKLFEVAAERPSAPSAARVISCPSNSSISFKVFLILFSSSIINIFISIYFF